MKFQIPQFIEVEDKIFGPLTLKQFIYLAGGSGISVIFYLLLPFWIALLFIGPMLGISAALAFYKINNKPFIVMLEAAFTYLMNPKLYIWKQEAPTVKAQATKEEVDVASSVFIPKLSDSKLKDLTWSLDVREALNPITKSDTIKQK